MKPVSQCTDRDSHLPTSSSTEMKLDDLDVGLTEKLYGLYDIIVIAAE